MDIEEAYAQGCKAAFEDFTKVALANPMAVRRMAMSGAGAVMGAGAGAMTAQRKPTEYIPGNAGGYHKRQLMRGAVGGVLGGVMGYGGGTLLNRGAQMAAHGGGEAVAAGRAATKHVAQPSGAVGYASRIPDAPAPTHAPPQARPQARPQAPAPQQVDPRAAQPLYRPGQSPAAAPIPRGEGFQPSRPPMRAGAAVPPQAPPQASSSVIDMDAIRGIRRGGVRDLGEGVGAAPPRLGRSYQSDAFNQYRTPQPQAPALAVRPQAGRENVLPSGGGHMLDPATAGPARVSGEPVVNKEELKRQFAQRERSRPSISDADIEAVRRIRRDGRAG